MKPTTPLPWEYDPTLAHYAHKVIRHNGMIVGVVDGPKDRNEIDGHYIVHACNQYPRLVGGLRECADALAAAEERLAGEYYYGDSEDVALARELLAECEEA
jgi:hypothetical protein